MYDYDAASALCFYKPETIRRMCDDRTLTAGVHFIVRTYRTGRFARTVRLVTNAGVAFLLDRQKHRIKPKHGSTRGETTTRTST